MTKKRQQILDVLKQADGAFTAAEVFARVSDIDLVTVYRNLELFTKEKLIKEVNLGSDETYFEFQAKPHHHAVCTDCGQVIHFEVAEDKLRDLLCFENFSINDVEVTVQGKCGRHV